MKKKITVKLSYLSRMEPFDDSTLAQIRALHEAGVGTFELRDWFPRAASIEASVPFDDQGNPDAKAVEALQNYLLRHAKRMNAYPIFQPVFTTQSLDA